MKNGLVELSYVAVNACTELGNRTKRLCISVTNSYLFNSLNFYFKIRHYQKTVKHCRLD